MRKPLKEALLSMLALMMSFTFMTACSPSDESLTKEQTGTKAAAGKYKDGVYEGKAAGKGGDIVVKVTVSGGDISKVEVVEHQESDMISDEAINRIVSLVESEKSTNVDVVSGATMTSEAVIEAIKSALVQAGGSEATFAADPKVKSVNKEAETEQTYEVVVIGGGGAGLSAAVEASQAGAKVVVLEKMSSVGGNTLVSGGGLNVPGSDQQKKFEVSDSVDQFVEDTMNGGDNINDKELVQVLAENALPTAKWLINEINVEFMPDRLQQFGGHSVPRALIAKDNQGTDLIEKLKAKADELGVVFKMETKAEELIVDDNGRVTGVKASNAAEQELTFHATKGVIIASGGFGSNVEMRKKYNPEFDEKYMTTDVPGTTGDGIVMAEKIGADLVHMEHIQTYPTCNPMTGIISYVANSRFDGAVLLNQEGKRFVEEMERRDVISRAILDQTGSYAYLVWGQEVEEVGHMTDVHQQEYESFVNDKLLHKADSIEELADFFEIDVQTMKKSIDTYNKQVEKGKDTDFNRRGTLRPIAKAPFYIQKVVPSIHHTMGGLKINPQSQVLTGDGEVIPGLFAAGEVTGGIHGTNRLGGNAVTDVTVFGRIAGQNVVKE
ncbi:flavocytochrome c [Paenibacillus faecalis]|uniref:flavocytochrome c n=1 Tax=Paenibacillus faecalis TaxID=2079532 RepID=UPI000D0FADDB|nr:flavocytochrome c [Paenibacillus faecalis]